jgi:hypothetical protein
MTSPQYPRPGRSFALVGQAAIALVLLATVSARPSAAQGTQCGWQIVASPNRAATGGHRIQNQLEAVLAL